MPFHQPTRALPTMRRYSLHLLALLLCLTLLTACFGGSESEPVAEIPTDTPVAQATVTPPASQVPEATPAVDASTNASASAQTADEPLNFQIDPEQSEARFIVDEILFDEPNNVVGRTNEVSGTIAINLADPTQTTVGVISINARSLATDNRFRNRSVNRLILQSNRDEYQYITFTPTSIDGLPAAAAVGDSFSFQIMGDLKIREIVQPTTFEVTVTADSNTQISGLAQTVVQRADFELTIPNVEGVADVTEEVQLELEFVAAASE